MDNKIEIRNLTKVFNDVPVLDNVCLDIPRGEITVFVGPSGCGKTTMMRCIVGFETPEQGTILIDGKDIAGTPPKDRDIAMVFQYYSLYPNMTVRKNLSVALELTTDLTKAEISDRVEEIARILNLSHLLERKPSQLSGGEAQRVSIGRALVRNAGIIFLDEPLSAVDAKLRRELRLEIRRILKKFGVTAIYVTHDQEEAMAIADRMVLMGQGHILGIGSPDELYKKPFSVAAAKLLGRPMINLMPALVEADALVCNGSLRIPITDAYAKQYLDGYAGKQIELGVRPCDIILGGAQAEAMAEGTVVSVENLGDEINVFVDCGGIELSVHADPSKLPNIGDCVRFYVPQSHLQLFDADTQVSLLWKETPCGR